MFCFWQKGRVLYERKATPILIAVAYMIDAILEIENDDLDTIYHCDERQLKTLSNIFEPAVVSSKTIPIDVDTFSVLNESVTSFLKCLKFIVRSDSIQPPKTKTCVAECIFCVLYCLSSWKLCFKSWSETSMKVVLQILTLNFIMWTLLWNWCMCSEQTHKYHLNFIIWILLWNWGMCFDTNPQISLELQISLQSLP